ncbi:hypothetical protein [Pseudoponticoccus marisrubri]|uniref:Uncharacterized protein n=1 Tax=Pseudoponticoccus marisrubri TaxID=1685382 RepID=A0A0W7WEA9_9RHOB|nr:hypothetical protein [Pseudoponticoccus marisrubri]KUF08782.1 hypothetical protein AVJ23_20915 [Pseudoponticoccus marisrubri]
MRILLFLLAVLAAGPALSWETPQRGTTLRATLMDAVRPHAEWVLGAPVVFRVDDLRVSGDLAFANLHALRPNGAPIDPASIPRRPGVDNPFDWDGPQIQALLVHSGAGWSVMHHEIGATDVWWADPALCPQWRFVLTDTC